jgi:hypothetical protein
VMEERSSTPSGSFGALVSTATVLSFFADMD